jgi:ABC-type dipeptide/oligopeptide/nickel transport system permease subunit
MCKLAQASRARPTFLYVIYTCIGMCFVGAIAGVFYPEQVTTAAQNLTNLLAAIPESLWWLFGASYLGYTGGRSFDKYQRARQGRTPVKGLPRKG